jgi:hypothetical protein
MIHPDESRLNDLVDDRLPDRERVRVLEHLDRCESCRAVVAELRALKAAAALLGRDVPPDPGVWKGIEERIRGSARPRLDRLDHPAPLTVQGGSRITRTGSPGRLLLLRAAVGAMLVGASAGTIYLSVRMGEDGGSGPLERSASATASGIEVPPGSPVHVRAIADAYGPALDELESLLEEGRDRLQPETLIVLEENLRIIDGAIREVMEALESDPGFPGGFGSLNGMYDLRIRLLRQAVDLTREA